MKEDHPKKQRIGMSCALLTITLISNSQTYSAEVDPTEILVVAKFSGFCGAISQMHDFQQVTKMPGGDEFVSRFLATEAARLGLNVKKMLENCAHSAQIYDALQRAGKK